MFQRLQRMEEFEGTGIRPASECRTIARNDGRTWLQSIRARAQPLIMCYGTH
jgi:hypothetical protein